MGSDLSSFTSATSSNSIHISKGSEDGRILFNGREYRGRTLNSINGKVYVDGKPVDEIEVGVKYSPITIKVEGSVTGNIDVPYVDKIEITGDLHGSIKTQAGSIHVGGSVSQDARTMSGSVVVGGDVHGHASTMSGNVFTGHGMAAVATASRPALKAAARGPVRALAPAARAALKALAPPPSRPTTNGGVIKRPAVAVKREAPALSATANDASLKRPREDAPEASHDVAEPLQKKARM